MSKKILILYYTQSGQLTNILNNYTNAFRKKGHEVEFICVKPVKDFPFPWTSEQFFSIMPDCVLGRTIAIEDIKLKHTQYDLIVLGYQPWFLSPSLPVNAILSHPSIRSVLSNTPVVAICGARNMWINALQKIKMSLSASKAKLVGTIVLVDKNPNLISVITILYWMFTGKKEKYLGIFPKPGVSDTDMEACHLYGELTEKYMVQGDYRGLQEELLQHQALVVKYNLLFTELKADRIFSIWANFIDKRKNKKTWLIVFKYYLIFALFIVAPILILMNTLLIKPFIKAKIKKQISYYSSVNL